MLDAVKRLVIDAAKAPCRHEPRTGVLRQSLLGPFLERGPERVVQSLLRPVEIPEQPDESREHGTRLALVDGFDPPVEIRCSHFCRVGVQRRARCVR